MDRYDGFHEFVLARGGTLSHRPARTGGPFTGAARNMTVDAGPLLRDGESVVRPHRAAGGLSSGRPVPGGLPE